MQTDGKILGYNKKVVLSGLLIISAIIIFYAGAQYEKHKLTSMGLLSNGTCAATKPKTAKKSAAPANASQNATNSTTTDSNTTTNVTPGTSGTTTQTVPANTATPTPDTSTAPQN